MPGKVEVGSSANSYEILAKLAAGGMAEVFLARSKSATGVVRYCVLKRILAERAADPSFVEMFLDEARLAAQLQHANIAQVYDLGTLGDSYFYTLEYVHGETLRQLLYRAAADQKDLPHHVVLAAIAGTAAGLHHAHERIGHDGRALKIVHRDVSPSNLIVGYDGVVKIIDFGIAKAAHRMRHTQAGVIKGKIGYLSPEQCRGNSLDRRSDLFALGVVMWEMLTLDRLYRRGNDLDSMTAIVNEPPLPPSRRIPSVPPAIDAIVMRLLEKDPERRYQTAAQLVDEIERVAAQLGLQISPASLGRHMRETFGNRREPWLELEQFDVSSAVSVVTSPIAAEDLLVAGSTTGHFEAVQTLSDIGGLLSSDDDDDAYKDENIATVKMSGRELAADMARLHAARTTAKAPIPPEPQAEAYVPIPNTMPATVPPLVRASTAPPIASSGPLPVMAAASGPQRPSVPHGFPAPHGTFPVVPQPAVHGEIDGPRSRARTIAIVCGGIGLGLMLVLAISGESDVAPKPVGAPVDAGVDANENNGIRQPD